MLIECCTFHFFYFSVPRTARAKFISTSQRTQLPWMFHLSSQLFSTYLYFAAHHLSTSHTYLNLIMFLEITGAWPDLRKATLRRWPSVSRTSTSVSLLVSAFYGSEVSICV